ncbi:unnamed protein product [Kuraishia capsulata CBS 1993]|uniref:Uncharacterized protein n=1 Tax=Kuraishia capsulata CBS 1993 TaxID=1382522 RepID=W6MVQ5_9ASCO|nr:uncharacterized protein KUCA_T00002397001 [Kuraishia capsulata CBS 1993]CDK26425.1 unnamed protein product [Kuraishia capsulata CBS 1993]
MSGIMGPDQPQDIKASETQPISIAARETLGHPSPELLASSVGNEVDGRLVPSSSTISLLSLSMQQQQQQQQQTDESAILSSQIPINFTRMSSFNQQQRHQHYQSSSNLTNIASGFSSRRVSMNSPGVVQLPSFKTSPREIPPREDFTPDSPNLNPVSLGGSPSKFWLTSQTPPNSLPFLQLQRINSSQHLNSLRGVSRGSMNRGVGASPVLFPVGTPYDGGPPMTPLQLSNQSDYISYKDQEMTNSLDDMMD